MEHAYEPAFNAIIHYIRSYGIYHQVLNSRMLWDDTARNVSIFDLGDDIERDPNDADDQDLVCTQIYISKVLHWTSFFPEERSSIERIQGMAQRWHLLSGLVCQWSTAVIPSLRT